MRLLEILEDSGGFLSSKRVVFFVLLILYIFMTVNTGLGYFQFSESIIGNVVDMIKWMGGFIAAEGVSSLIASKK